MNQERIIYSIGHSSLSIDQFLQLLNSFQIRALVDVRRFPSSKKYPHFERTILHHALQQVNVEYHWLGDSLGGFRDGGYQAHMQTDLFSQGLHQLIVVATQHLTAFMCAEKLFLHCHRRFISDQLANQGWTVIHIFDDSRTYLHQHTDTLPFDFTI